MRHQNKVFQISFVFMFWFLLAQGVVPVQDPFQECIGNTTKREQKACKNQRLGRRGFYYKYIYTK